MGKKRGFGCDKIVIEFVGVDRNNYKGWNCWKGFNGLISKENREARHKINPL